MPRRKIYRRKRPVVHKTYRKKKLTRVQRRQIIRLVHEPKYITGTLNAAAVQLTPTLGFLSMPAQGDTAVLREGDQIVILSVIANMNFVVADTTNIIRVIFFQWKPDNSLDAPSSADILAETALMPYLSPLTRIVKARTKWRLLYDRKFSLSTTGPATKHATAYLRPKLRVNFTAGSAASGCGFIYYLLCSDSAAVSHPTLNMSVVTNYRDV